MGRRVLLGVTGGIAAYKAVEVLRLLTAAGCEVQVLQTRAALDFVGPATFAALSGQPVLFDQPEPGAAAADRGAGFPHLDPVRGADAFVVAPATANVLARMAAGMGDGLLLSSYLACRAPVLVAPAMNTAMWEHPATRRALAQLVADGVRVVAPGAGVLACGDVGEGRLAEPDAIARAVLAAAGGGRGDLTGRTVLVTAGGTSEPVDGVRVLTNRSSGRMGIALARAARDRGADVLLVTTATVDPDLHRDLAPAESVTTAAQLATAVERAAPGADVVLMAAAVSDFTVADAPAGKLDRAARTLELSPTQDILAGLAERRRGGGRPLLVGFAAEVGPDGLARARAKRTRKGVDLVVHNDVARGDIGFASTHNAVTVIGPDGERAVDRAPKAAVADAILDEVVGALAERSMAGAQV